jgi:hypothetical protein
MSERKDVIEIAKPPTEAHEDVPIREMILHILQIYPVISPTMLQNALGPWLKAALWRPVLDELIEEGLIVMTTETKITPRGRYNAYKKLSLAEQPEIPPQAQKRNHGSQRKQSATH